MIPLLRSEFLRFRSRSMVVGLIVAALLIIPVVMFVMTITNDSPTPTELEQAEQGYQACLRWIHMTPEAQREFRQANRPYDYSDPYYYGWCDEKDPAMGYAPGLALVQLPDFLVGAAAFWIGLGLLMGASSVGADWHARSMTTLLTWEARRTRVFLARVATVAVSVFVIALFFQTVLGLGYAVTTALRGTWFHVDGAWAADTAMLMLRVSLVAGIFAALGAGLAMAVRTTAGAIGLLFAYGLLETFMQATAYHPVLWTYGVSFLSFLSQEPIETNYDYTTHQVHEFDPGAAPLVMLLYTVIFLAGAGVVFHKRDVS